MCSQIRFLDVSHLLCLIARRRQTTRRCRITRACYIRVTLRGNILRCAIVSLPNAHRKGVTMKNRTTPSISRRNFVRVAMSSFVTLPAVAGGFLLPMGPDEALAEEGAAAADVTAHIVVVKSNELCSERTSSRGRIPCRRASTAEAQSRYTQLWRMPGPDVNTCPSSTGQSSIRARMR